MILKFIFKWFGPKTIAGIDDIIIGSLISAAIGGGLDLGFGALFGGKEEPKKPNPQGLGAYLSNKFFEPPMPNNPVQTPQIDMNPLKRRIV